jgi:uncharacterized protein (TIGR02996 family)
MSEEAGFLSAIQKAPADETTRLVYADWLDEQGDPTMTARAEFIRLELRMTKAPEQSLNRIRWLNKLQKLAANIDARWLAIVSQPKLEACRMQFQFECPKQWEKLTPTNDAKVRFCESCKKRVHYCTTLREANNRASQAQCVAVTLGLIRHAGDMFTPRRPGQGVATVGTPMRLAPEMIVRLGMPRMNRPTVTAAPETRNDSQSPLPPERRPRRRKRQRRNRNIQLENWEELE